MPQELRVWLQRGLIWTDHYVGIADGNFSQRSINAVRSYQRSTHQAPTGLLTVDQAKRLSATAQNVETAFGYRLHNDTYTGVTIGLPAKFVSFSGYNKRGAQFASSNGAVDMTTIRIPLAERSLADLYQLHIQRPGRQVGYKVFRGDWFVVSGFENGKHFYVRAHAYGSDVRGYALSYPAELAEVFGRLSTAMSSDFRPDSASKSVAESRMNWNDFGSRFIGDQNAPANASPPPAVSAAPITPQPSSPPSAQGGPTLPPKGSISTGTGFLVSTAGHFITNAHVVEGCSKVGVGSYGNSDVIDRDTANDLAIIKVSSMVSGKPIALSEAGPRLGESIMALGYPLQNILQNGLNVTKGDISSVAGLNGDSRFLQFTAAIQPGNSGGPLVNAKGGLVGVVTSKLNAMKVASATGDIPQSINFAIRPEILELYLRRFNVPIARQAADVKQVEPHELVQAIQGSVAMVICTK